MSATGRNLPGKKRRKDDAYFTPSWVTLSILPFLEPADHALDPCAGNGAILSVLHGLHPAPKCSGIEIDRKKATISRSRCGDALTTDWPKADLVITNPPYSLALEFILKAQEQLPHAERAFLLRLNFLGSQGRSEFHRKYPADIYVLSRRPSFTEDGKTDATEYAWWVWGPGHGGRWKIL